MTQIPPKENKAYDLEGRTFKFAQNVRAWVKELKPSIVNQDDIRQLIRSSGSVGANYIEANESLSKKDFLLRVKICRKEAKESEYWIRLLDVSLDDNSKLRQQVLLQEATELRKIFGAIVEKSRV
jgi:four helix bundle protein